MTLDIPDDVVWLTRGKDWGSRFLSTGPFTNDEALRLYDAIFAKCADIPYSVGGRILKNGMEECHYVAQRFYDPARRDAAGRRIIHEIIAVSRSSALKRGTTSQVFDSCVKEFYDGVFDSDGEKVAKVGRAIGVRFDAENEPVESKDVVIADVATGRGCGSFHRLGFWLPLAVALVVVGFVFSCDRDPKPDQFAVDVEARRTDIPMPTGPSVSVEQSTPSVVESNGWDSLKSEIPKGDMT